MHLSFSSQHSLISSNQQRNSSSDYQYPIMHSHSHTHKQRKLICSSCNHISSKGWLHASSEGGIVAPHNHWRGRSRRTHEKYLSLQVVIGIYIIKLNLILILNMGLAHKIATNLFQSPILARELWKVSLNATKFYKVF